MPINIKKVPYFILATLCPLSVFTEETSNNKYRAQDINLKTSLYQNDHLSFYLEGDVGYRHDSFNNFLELYNDLWDIDGSRQQKADLTQLTFKAGTIIHEYIFARGSIGYAFLNKDHDTESSYLWGTDYLINSYEKSFSKGHAYDALIGGGARIPLYPDYLALDAEVGYNYKKIYIKNSLETKVSSPYVGGTLYGTPGWDVQFAFYGNYFFLPTLKESGYLYIVNDDSFSPTPTINTNKNVTAYTIGLNVSYMFFDHMSVNFNWDRFSVSSGYEEGSFAIPVLGSVVTGSYAAKLDYWNSNQYTFGFRYTF